MPEDGKLKKKKVLVVEEVADATKEVEDKKSVDDTKSEAPQEIEPVIEESQEKPNYLWIIIPTTLLVGALVGGFITYFSGIASLSQTQVTPVPTVEPVVETPTPKASTTPSSAIKKEDLKIQVLNGSGVPGAAGEAKAFLEGLGYKNIEVGNAQSSNFETTEVSIKEVKKDYLDVLVKDLSEEYEVNKKTGTVPASGKFDIIITLGKK